MDIEKIKNYNQKVLAVLLTTLIAFAVIGLLSLIIFLFTEVFNFSRSSNNYNQEGLQVETAKTEAAEGDAYKLHVSYNFPDLADTLNQLYIIPVSHQTQYELESSLIKRGRYSKVSSYDQSGVYDYNSQSTYINLLIYDSKSAKLEKLFKQQILIGDYAKYYYKDDVIIVFEAADKDSDKDGRLTIDDETSLYFYSITNKTLKQAKIAGQTVLQYSFISETKNAIIRFGINPNQRKNDGKFISPGTLSRFDYDSDKLANINDIQLDKELETIAEGKK